jgi:hypothetical protein
VRTTEKGFACCWLAREVNKHGGDDEMYRFDDRVCPENDAMCLSKGNVIRHQRKASAVVRFECLTTQVQP